MNALNLRHLLIVLVVSAIAIALLISAQTLLHDRIANNQKQAALQPLLTVFPQSLQEQVKLEDAGTLNDADSLGLRAATRFYRTYIDNQLIGWVVPAVARDGYSGDISLVIALNLRAEIIGVQVLDHHETAGMGDRMERRHSNWLEGFNQRSLRSPTTGSWYVSKDGGAFDQITGATTTSRAVTKAVKQTLEYYSAHHDEWTAIATPENPEAAHE